MKEDVMGILGNIFMIFKEQRGRTKAIEETTV
jgi:hypothetical protein